MADGIEADNKPRIHIHTHVDLVFFLIFTDGLIPETRVNIDGNGIFFG